VVNNLVGLPKSKGNEFKMTAARNPADWLADSISSTERHYAVQDVAELWKLSKTMIRDLFRNEPGVLKAERPGTRFKRVYVTLRIPQSVLDRVHRRMLCRA
jgi:hypothetical protein